MSGDCFNIVYQLVTAPDMVERMLQKIGRPPYIGSKSPLRICHGLPIARIGPLKGLRHWHAWVELTEENSNILVLDLSNDQQIRVDRDTFYEIGTLDEEHIWRFTPKEARQAVQKFHTKGPWVKDWWKLAKV